MLETRRSTGAQTFAVDGYASIERKGNIDSLVLSELAYDREIFEQKVVDNELLYYGRDKQHEDERRLQYLLIDCSASMRGQRQVFARGLALALIKKLTLEGDEIWVRFFDSRLHETVKIARSGQVPVPYLLSFRSERGRNYGKVFRQLLVEVTRLRREQKRRVVMYIITHGQCHIEPELVTALKQQAFLYGVVCLPSSRPAARVRAAARSLADRARRCPDVARRAPAPRARHRRRREHRRRRAQACAAARDCNLPVDEHGTTCRRSSDPQPWRRLTRSLSMHDRHDDTKTTPRAFSTYAFDAPGRGPAWSALVAPKHALALLRKVRARMLAGAGRVRRHDAEPRGQDIEGRARCRPWHDAVRHPADRARRCDQPRYGDRRI